ncbi:DUF2634 domain-containing protein [Clostridium sp. Mt-5]|uniref:DUF2634 domain-containing protein n=1 Tax=Clostridium moutaii TaxID=3240932 RepID=A0ABV4BS65_9CLOT
MTNIFPLIPGLQEQLDNISNTSTAIQKLGKTFKFDFNTNTFVLQDGKLVELSTVEAVEQWISLILRTYKDKYNVYKGTDFYCNIEDLAGGKKDNFSISEIDGEISEALLKHRYITDVSNFSVSYDRRTININFDVTLLDGTTLSENTSL